MAASPLSLMGSRWRAHQLPLALQRPSTGVLHQGSLKTGVNIGLQPVAIIKDDFQ